VPHRFRLASGAVMGFAGLWSVWNGGEGTKRLFTCCVITTAANELVKPFHDRMPAILAPDEYETWFDNDTPLKELHALLKPYPEELMEVSAASPLVNNPKNEGPRLLDPGAQNLPFERTLVTSSHRPPCVNRMSPTSPVLLSAWQL
jgi:putative SOS response-associated peptidase YedK